MLFKFRKDNGRHGGANGNGQADQHAVYLSAAAEDVTRANNVTLRGIESQSGLLGRALTDTRGVGESLVETATQADGVSSAALQIASSVNELAASIEQVNANSNSVATAVVQTATSIEEINRSINSVAKSAGEMTSAAQALATSATETAASVRSITTDGENLANTVNEMAAAAEEMERTIEGVVANADEMATAAEETSSSINEMAASIEQVAASAENMAGMNEQVANAIEENARSIQNVAQAAETISASVAVAANSAHELEQSFRSVARLASETDEITRRAAQDAKEGGAGVERSIQGLGRVRDSMSQSATVVREVGKRAGEISGIVDTINLIAERTNLLSLNASIEAARAGEAGRGFAVVAEEIRNLADRSARATSDIATIIKALQDVVQDAVTSSAEGQRVAEESGRLAEDGLSGLRRILDGVEQLAESEPDRTSHRGTGRVRPDDEPEHQCGRRANQAGFDSDCGTVDVDAGARYDDHADAPCRAAGCTRHERAGAGRP